MLFRYVFATGIGLRVKLKFPVLLSGIRRKITISNGSVVERFANIICEKNGFITIGKGCYIGSHSYLKAYGGRIQIGHNCSINAFTFINGAGGVLIGDDVRIAAHCSIISSNHIFSDSNKLIRCQGTTKKGIKIGSNVWIGTGVRILDGVSIGDGAVIGAGAVVITDIEKFGVAVGVPARLVKIRPNDNEN